LFDLGGFLMRGDALDRLRSENPLPELLPGLPLEAIRERLDQDPAPGLEPAMRAGFRSHAQSPGHLRLGRRLPAWRLVVVLVGLVVVTPAIAAATNWFGLGAPQRLPSRSPENAGRALPGTSELLGLRVPDPQGGPPWGLRIVHTSRADICLQFGRVESGRLGSLGIDDAFHNDHRFHPFPNSSIGSACGTTDAAGHGFVNAWYSGEVANANPMILRGLPANNCRPAGDESGHGPLCPPGSTRIVFTGLLGPDATSITYKAPDGKLRTERTSGREGAYLLVFPDNPATCRLYAIGSPCAGTFSPGAASPGPNGAITAITYREGHVCRVALGCPPVGYVASKHKPVTPAQVATPIHVKTISAQGWCQRRGRYTPNTFWLIPCNGAVPSGYERMRPLYRAALVDVSLKAREPAARGSSWYEIYISDGCHSGGTGALLGRGTVHSGEALHYQDLANRSCKGVYHGTVGYMQHSPPTNPDNMFGVPGKDGSTVVGHFSFTIR
jgi:hypothetical protein